MMVMSLKRKRVRWRGSLPVRPWCALVVVEDEDGDAKAYRRPEEESGNQFELFRFLLAINSSLSSFE